MASGSIAFSSQAEHQYTYLDFSNRRLRGHNKQQNKHDSSED